MFKNSKSAWICVLVCLGSPAWGSFHHGPSTVGVPVGVPVPVPVPVPSPYPVPSPVAVPAPVAVPVSDTVTIPAVYNAHQAFAYGTPEHYAPAPPPAIFKYASSYAAPQPVIKYSLGAPVTTTTTTYTGFAAPSTAHFAAAPPVQFAAPPPPQFLTRYAAPPTGYQFAAAPSFGRYKLHFGAPPPPSYHHSPAAVYGAPPATFNTQGW